jgi:hypothetical protein
MTPRRLPFVVASAMVLVGCSAATPESLPTPVFAATPPASDAPYERPADDWVTHFAEFAARDEAAATTRFWGSFGDPGTVAASDTRDATLPAGEHLVIVDCGGPQQVTITLSGLDDEGSEPAEPSETYELECPGGVALDLTTARPGIAVLVDPHGEPGAYMVRIDPEPNLTLP